MFALDLCVKIATGALTGILADVPLAGPSLLLLPLSAALDASVLCWLLWRARWRGPQLALAILTLLLGGSTLLPLLDLPQLMAMEEPPVDLALIPWFLGEHAVNVLILCLCGMAITDRGQGAPDPDPDWPAFSRLAWAGCVLGCALGYIVLYAISGRLILFGMASEVIASTYGDDLPPLNPWALGVRGLAVGGMAILAVRLLRARKLEIVVGVGLMLGLFAAAPRLAHDAGLAPILLAAKGVHEFVSHFAFGMIVVFVARYLALSKDRREDLAH